VFPLRNFTARDLYVRRTADPPARGSGRQAQSALQLHGQRLDLVIDTSSATSASIRRDPVVGRRHRPPRGRRQWTSRCPWGARAAQGALALEPARRRRVEAILQHSEAGELPSRSGPCAAFSDFRAVEQEYFGRPARFPAAPNRPAARGLGPEPVDRPHHHEAFSAANDVFTAAQKGFPVRDTVARGRARGHRGRHGVGFPSIGLEQNRAQIEMFAGEAFRLGLTARRVTVEDILPGTFWVLRTSA
jgi:hypothetical protein